MPPVRPVISGEKLATNFTNYTKTGRLRSKNSCKQSVPAWRRRLGFWPGEPAQSRGTPFRSPPGVVLHIAVT